MITGQIASPKILNPARIGSLFYLGFFLSAGSYGPYLYVHFTELGISGQQIGWLASLSPLMMLIFATPLSSLADRKRWRVVMTQTGIAGLSVILFFLRYASTFNEIAILALAMAVFASPIMGIADSLIARMAQRRTLNYGAMRLWGSVGFASSALAFGALWQRLGFEPMFLVGSFLFLTLIWITGKLEEGPLTGQSERGPISHLLSDPGLILLLIATFLAGISNSLTMTFEGILVNSLGGTSFLIGIMTAFAAFSELPVMFYGQRIANRFKAPYVVVFAFALVGCAHLGYMLVANPGILPLFSIFKGLGFGLYFPLMVRILTERTPQAWASTAQSLMSVSLFGLAPLVAGPLGGLIHDAISPAAVFGLGVLSLALAALVLGLAALRGKLD